MSATRIDPSRGLAAFRVFLRVYGVLTLAIFVLLFAGFVAQSPLLAEHGGALNWTIWNDVRCGAEHLHVPPMLMVIYISGPLISAAHKSRRAGAGPPEMTATPQPGPGRPKSVPAQRASLGRRLRHRR